MLLINQWESPYTSRVHKLRVAFNFFFLFPVLKQSFNKYESVLSGCHVQTFRILTVAGKLTLIYLLLSYLLKIMCTLFQNREQNSVRCHAQFVHPTFVWRYPLNDSDILINSILNCLRHHVVPPLGHP